MRRGSIAFFLALLVVVSHASSQPPEYQERAPVRFSLQPRYMIDFPTAGLSPRGGFYIEADIYSEGGVLFLLGVGFARYFSFGISYGGLNVIGSGDPDMNPKPGVQLKARLVEESFVVPAVAIGFDSQGRGPYLDDLERYLMKSRGVYAVASKNWDLLGPFSLHGGISYSLENEDKGGATVFFGAIKNFSGFLDIRAEYDFAINDDWGDEPHIEDDGILNASVVWHVNDNFSLGVEARDILTGNKVDLDDLREWNRGISITYRGIL